MFNNMQKIEPFKLFGIDSIIHNNEEAIVIVKENRYYTNLYGIILILYAIFLFIYGDLNKVSVDIVFYILFGLIFLLMGFIIKKYMSRIAVIIIAIPIIFEIIDDLIKQSHGMLFLLNTFTLMAIFRMWKATNFYNKNIK